MDNIIIRTVVPIMLLIAAGYLSRKINALKAGDERVLSAYVFYFALPALFFINLSEVFFNQETLRFIIAAVLPIFTILFVYLVLYWLFRIGRGKLYLLILSSVFGSVAFFGIPFVMFAYPSPVGERLAVLAAAVISMVSVTISITTLEIFDLGRKGETSAIKGFLFVLNKLIKNPLILSILFGVLIAVLGIKLPMYLKNPLHMLGKTTATVAIFMLGVFLYGRKYSKLTIAFLLSLLRILLLPSIALLVVYWLGMSKIEGSIIVLMHSMPLAISMMVLSHRYDFNQETIASLIMLSSLGAIVYLNLWVLILGIK
jgi:predicted permease